MKNWAHVGRFLALGLAIAVLWSGRGAVEQLWRRLHPDPNAAARAEFNRVYGGKDVRILQFYARDGVVKEGHTTVICYGVLNARSVRVDPPLEGVSPALSRCLEVGPERNTRYTLTAVGADGQTATESLALAVRPDDETLPRITSFQVAGRQLDYRGRTVFLVEFTVQNAEEVSIDPPAFPTLHRAPNGRFYISPERTTTYTLTATGVRGHLARRQLKLEVPE